MSTDTPLQTWELTVDERAHRVEVEGTVRHQVRWWVDGELVGEERSAEETVRVEPTDSETGVLVVRFSGLGAPRRATVHPAGDATASAKALTGLGGVDLEPEPDSPAAAHEDRVRAHPRRYALIAGTGGVLKVVVPLLVVLLLSRFAFALPWPDWSLPSIPSPDLPSLPLPDLPSIPWPDVTVPGWLRWVLDHATYVVPVVLALVVARAEIKRRRTQDELRAARREKRE